MIEKNNKPTINSDRKCTHKITAPTLIMSTTDRIINPRTTKKIKRTTTKANVFEDDCS